MLWHGVLSIFFCTTNFILLFADLIKSPPVSSVRVSLSTMRGYTWGYIGISFLFLLENVPYPEICIHSRALQNLLFQRKRHRFTFTSILLLWIRINHAYGAIRVVRQLGKFDAALVIDAAGKGTIVIEQIPLLPELYN